MDWIIEKITKRSMMTQSYTMKLTILFLFTFLVSSSFIHAEVIDLYDHNFEHLTQASTGKILLRMYV